MAATWTSRPNGRVRWTKAMERLRDSAAACPRCGAALVGTDLAEGVALLAAECGKHPAWRAAIRLRLLEAHGVEALPTWAGVSRREDLADLAAVEAEPALAQLAGHLGEPSVRKQMIAAGQRWPGVVTQLLLARAPAATSHAGGLVRDLLGTEPAWAEAALAGPQGAVAARLLAVPAGPFAPRGRWPELLAQPPWSRARAPLPRMRLAPTLEPPVLHPELLPPPEAWSTPLEYARAVVEQSARSCPEAVAAAPTDPVQLALYLLGVPDPAAALDGVPILALGPAPLRRGWLLLGLLPPVAVAAVAPAFLDTGAGRENLLAVLHYGGAAAVPAAGPWLWSASATAPLALAVEWDGLALETAAAMRSRWLARRAREWLVRYPGAAARGLLRAALSGDDVAAEAVRIAAEADLGAVQRVSAEAESAARALLDCDPALAVDEAPALPPLLPVGLLPRPSVAGLPLPEEAMADLLRILALDSPERPHAATARILGALGNTDALGLALLEWWVRHGHPQASRWIVAVAGRSGDPRAVRRLGAVVVERRAALDRSAAYDALAAIVAMAGGPAGDAALQELARLAARPRAADIAARADEALETVARERGLSVEELADRTVPDLGLGENGRLTLDLGGREVSVRLGADLDVQVWDGPKRLKSLPRGAPPETAAGLRAIKTGAAQLASTLPRRLERAMVDERTWTPEEFATLVAGHPVVRLLAARLIWTDGATTFRPDLAGGLLGPDDAVVTAGGAVRIVHPLTLAPELRAAWTRALREEDVVAPFPQLQRFTAGPPDGPDLPGVGAEVSVGAVLGLEARGWARAIGDGGVIGSYERRFGRSGVTVAFEPGWFVGERPEPGARVRLTRTWPWPAPGWDALPAVAVSEAARDLHLLTGGTDLG